MRDPRATLHACFSYTNFDLHEESIRETYMSRVDWKSVFRTFPPPETEIKVELVLLQKRYFHIRICSTRPLLSD